MQKNRTQRKLPGGDPPVVTYSRRREEELPDAYDDGRAEPRFDDEPVAEWDAVEVPPVEPPLHARRRARPLVEPVRTPLDEADFEDRPVKPAQPKRSTSLRLIAVVAVAAVIIGVVVLVFAFGNSSTVTVSAPALNEEGAAPGTVPADDVANANPGVREIPLTGEGGATDAGGTSAPAPVSTVPVEPPAPRARPEPPASAATAVAPDFDQAAPMPPAEAALTPKAATAPVDSGADDDFIARIERTLAETDGSSAPALSPAAEQPIQLTPQAAQPDEFVPPENIPMVDGQGQPLTLPDDFLLLDTE